MEELNENKVNKKYQGRQKLMQPWEENGWSSNFPRDQKTSAQDQHSPTMKYQQSTCKQAPGFPAEEYQR